MTPWTQWKQFFKLLTAPKKGEVESAPVSMEEFLRSGSLGGVRPGDTAGDLLRVFGEPDDTGGHSKRSVIWKYGDIEFHLVGADRTISLIFCDRYEQLSLGSGGSLDPWIFRGHPSMQEVEAALDSAGFRFQRGSKTGGLTGDSLRLESGVELLVCTEVDEFGWPNFPGLYGFQQVLREEAR